MLWKQPPSSDCKKHNLEDKNPIGAADLESIPDCNYEGTEQLHLI